MAGRKTEHGPHFCPVLSTAAYPATTTRRYLLDAGVVNKAGIGTGAGNDETWAEEASSYFELVIIN